MQPIHINVTMDESAFSHFVHFDAFQHRKSWKSPILFAAIMLSSAIICFLLKDRPQLTYIGIGLAVLGLIMPIVWFIGFPKQVKAQAERMALKEPRPLYALTFDDEGVSIQLDGKEETELFPWASLYCFYRTQEAIYFYAKKDMAFLVPSGCGDASDIVLWNMITSHLPASKAHDMLKKNGR